MKHKYLKNIKNDSGVVLIIVLGVLALLAILGTVFTVNMRLEQKASLNYANTLKVKFLTRSGFERALAGLNSIMAGSDLYRIDKTQSWYTTDWSMNNPSSMGSYIDLSGGWRGLFDITPLGNGGEGIVDEASKVNVNIAAVVSDTDSGEGYSPYELNLKSFLVNAGFTSARANAIGTGILNYRKGGSSDNWGVNNADDDGDNADSAANLGVQGDGIDNDGDGLVDEEWNGSAESETAAPDYVDESGDEGVDEPDEFDPENPNGNDVPFLTIEDIKNIPVSPALTDTEYEQIKNYITIHSYDNNKTVEGADKLNINSIGVTVTDIYNLLAANTGLVTAQAAQTACNIYDYMDDNAIPVKLTVASNDYYGVEGIHINEVMCNENITFEAQSDSGWWRYQAGQGGYLSNDNVIQIRNGTRTGSWSWAATNGTYVMTVYSNNGDVLRVDPESQGYRNVSDGGTYPFPVVVNGGTLNLSVRAQINEIFDYVALSKTDYIELINISKKDIDVNGWKLTIGSTTITLGAGKVYEGGSITSSIILGADYTTYDPVYDYFVITNDESAYDKSWGNNSGTWGDVSAENYIVFVPSTPADADIADDGTDTIILKDPTSAYTMSTASGYGFAAVTGSERYDPVGNTWNDSTDPAGNTPGAINDTYPLAVDFQNGTNDIAYVKDNYFASIGKVGKVRDGDLSTDWLTINLTVLKDIADKITVSGDSSIAGKININTANREVLSALPGVTATGAGGTLDVDNIIDYRDGADNIDGAGGDDNAFGDDTNGGGNARGIGEIWEVMGIDSAFGDSADNDGDGITDNTDEKEWLFRDISNLITVQSNCFTITSTGKVTNAAGEKIAERKIKAVLDRAESPVKIKSWQEITE